MNYIRINDTEKVIYVNKSHIVEAMIFEKQYLIRTVLGHTHKISKTAFDRLIGIAIDSAKQEKKKLSIEESVIEVIKDFNRITGKSLKTDPVSEQYKRRITALLNQGYTVEDFRIVTQKFALEWTATKFEQYIVPGTLFNGKFPDRVLQAREDGIDEREIEDEITVV